MSPNSNRSFLITIPHHELPRQKTATDTDLAETNQQRTHFLSFFFLFSAYALLAPLLAASQQNGQIGLPVVFVHGICDSPDSFLPIESAVKLTLRNHYPALYPPATAPYSDEYVTFYHRPNVWFQKPTADLSQNETHDPVSSVPSATRFFLVALDDPSQSSYTDFDPLTVMGVSIYGKGNELANILWRIKQLTGAPRAIVIGHSMGGLDARAYIEEIASPYGEAGPPVPYYNDIHTLVTIDTPHGGSLLAGLSSGEISVNLSFCAGNDSVDKSELNPAGFDPVTGAWSIIPQINYFATPSEQHAFPAAPLPPLLTITSIASYWDNIRRIDDGTDDVLLSATQDAKSNLADPTTDSASSLDSVDDTFTDGFTENGSSGNTCGTLAAPLHLLTCTGSSQQTFGIIESSIFPFAVMSQGLQITPLTGTQVASGGSLSFSIGSADAVVWSILEGQNGGTIDESGNYTAPANHTGSTETFHIVAIDGTDASRYGLVSVQVLGSATRTMSSIAVSASASQVPVGAPLSLSAAIQASGGVPTGTVAFYDGNTPLATRILDDSGVSIYSTSSLLLGFHTITAKYSGDSNYLPSSSSAITIAVVAIDPQLSVTPTSGTSGQTSFVKTDTGFTPSGAIVHTATLPGGGQDSFQSTADGNGRYQYSRIYSVPGNYSQVDTDVTSGQSTAPAVWVVSSQASNGFSLQASPSAQTVVQGASVSFNVATTTTSGSAQTIALTATNLPSGLAALFSPDNVMSGAASTLTVSAGPAAPGGTYTLTIVGSGVSTSHSTQFSVTVVPSATGPVASLSPSIVRFNDESVGSVSPPQTVRLMNSGSGQLSVSMISLAAGSDYALNLPIPAPPMILNPLVPYDIQVAVEPTTTGSRPGQIWIWDNAPDSPQVVNLTGNGTPGQPTMATINVNATLNGIALPTGSNVYNYTLSGPNSYSGEGPYSFSVVPGTYSIAFSGFPGYLTLSSATPSTSQSVSAGGSITFTLNFTAPNDFYPPDFFFPSGSDNGTPQVVPAGTTASYYVGLGNPPAGNASVPIALSVAGVPPGSTAVFDPEPMYTGYSGTLTIFTSESETPQGVYTLSLGGTNSSGLYHGNATTSLAVTGPPATPVSLISQNNAGAPANSASSNWSAPMSSDGRYVVFNSSATNLVPSGTAGVFIRDRQAGKTTLASVSNAGVAADGFFGASTAISGDGRFVAFLSTADNLGLGVLMGGLNRAVYIRDTVNGATEREDLASDGTASDGDSVGVAVSSDARFVIFLSNATNLVGGTTGYQVYRRDRQTRSTILVSVGNDGSPADSGISSIATNADGRFVAFDSAATNLVAQSTGGLNETFLRDVLNGTTILISASADGIPANARVYDSGGGTFGPIVISADGRYIAFNSMATNLVPQSVDGSVFHLYVHDTETLQNILVDSDSTGIPLGGASAFNFEGMSADGRFVSFHAFGQVLVRDIISQQTQVVSVAADGSPDNSPPISTPESAINPGGEFVAFPSASTNLVASNSNGIASVYVARNPFIGTTYLQSVILSSSPTAGGGSINGTVTLSTAAPPGGAVVAIWSDNSAVQLPAAVIVPQGAKSAGFTASTSLVSAETGLTIVGSLNGGSAFALLTLEPVGELNVSPAAWDFGYQAIGSSSITQSFVVTNVGTASLELNSVQLSTGKAFSLNASTCGTSLAVGASCAISVTFAPDAAGVASDSLQISTGNPAAIQSIALSGIGSTPVVSISPGSLGFGSQTMPGTAVQTATLTNSGNATLSNISVSISGANPSDFTLKNDSCSGALLPPNSNCKIVVSFAPMAKGIRTAVLKVADNASGSPQTTTMSGTGIQSMPVITWKPTIQSLVYGTPLSSSVLDAIAFANGSKVAGRYTYSASLSGGPFRVVTEATILGAGRYSLAVNFVPTDFVDYATARAAAVIAVNRARQVIDFAQPASPVVYGLAPFRLKATASSGLQVSFKLLSGPANLSGNALTITGAGTLTVAATQAGNGNFEPASAATRMITVRRATLTVKANDLSMKQGSKLPTLTYRITGFVRADTQQSSTAGQPRLTTAATSKSEPGSYPIKVSIGTLTARKYTFTLLGGTMSVTK